MATDSLGVTAGWRWTALESVGLYVPGGTASYPSSVLMNAIPARVAGVPRVVMVVPMPEGTLNPLVLAAAHLAGVDEVYRVGGAQAVAALAYGTDTIAPVAKIVGPGNAWVAAAKRRVFGQVGIDMIAGPSEVLILADAHANPDWVAADLLAQAEHDAAAQSILITDSDALADDVARGGGARADHPARGPRSPGRAGATTAPSSWCATSTRRCRWSTASPRSTSRSRPQDAEALAAQVRNAGAIFLGSHTPEAIGDYVGGPNHVLPTARSARFSSGLGVLDFMKRTTILRCDPAALAGARAPRPSRSDGRRAWRAMPARSRSA